LEKPNKPKQFAIKIIKIVLKGAISKNEVNIKNSLVNFKVPGKPEYNTHIKMIIIPKLGVLWIIPDNSTTDLELYRL